MSALDEARDHYLARAAEHERSCANDPAWLVRLRAEATAAFGAGGLPTTRWEEWRYTNVASLARIPFERAGAADAAAVTREQVESLATPVFACSLFVFVDGHFAPGLSSPRALTGELRVESLAQARTESPGGLEARLGSAVDCKAHPFAALNTAFLDDGAVLRIPEGADVESPIHLVFLSVREDPASVSHPRVLVEAGSGSRATVIQDHLSLHGGAAFTNSVTEAFVAPNAALDVVLLQRESAGSFHVSGLHVRQERDSRFASHTLSIGGALVRNDLGVVLGGEGADCTMNGLFVGEDSQVLDNHTLVDHALPHGTSRELYKGILSGEARGVFRGRVVVRPDAQHTDAQQSNPNLLTGDGAEVNTKPQLEIYADDVRCSHGSSIGRLDDDALFYLRSRGIGEGAARDLLTRGFAREVLDRLPVAALADGVDDLLSQRLRGAPAWSPSR